MTILFECNPLKINSFYWSNMKRSETQRRQAEPGEPFHEDHTQKSISRYHSYVLHFQERRRRIISIGISYTNIKNADYTEN